jgi:hypothetical protein
MIVIIPFHCSLDLIHMWQSQSPVSAPMIMRLRGLSGHPLKWGDGCGSAVFGVHRAALHRLFCLFLLAFRGADGQRNGGISEWRLRQSMNQRPVGPGGARLRYTADMSNTKPPGGVSSAVISTKRLRAMPERTGSIGMPSQLMTRERVI